MKTITSTAETLSNPNLNRRRCLTLNASYEPLTLVSARRALRLVMDGRAETVEVDPGVVVRSEHDELPVPSVIRLSRFVRVPRNLRRGVTNTILFARDRHTCLYCGRHRDKLGRREFLTRDHIIPQSRFDPREEANTWGNVATSCLSCNNRKGDRTPEEARMPLRAHPREPHFVHLEWTVRKLTPLQQKYVARFFGDEALELFDR